MTTQNWGLLQAFDLRQGDVVALVGGGGKTTALFRLATALAQAGRRVVTTTTTHIGREQSALASHHCWHTDPRALLSEVAATLEEHPNLLVTGPPAENGLKWGGLSPDLVAEMIALPSVDVVLVEADGAKHLPFKAPAGHEPVVPACTTCLVPVVGVDAVGQTVVAAAHRPEQVCRLTGLAADDRLTPAAIGTVLAHPAGGLKGRPAAARVRVLVNKVETEAQLAQAREIAQHVLAVENGPEAVLIGALAHAQPIRQVRRRIMPVVLAAGRSKRMGGDVLKQLLPWHGTTVLQRVVETVGKHVGPPLVVVGHRADEVREVLRGAEVRIVENPAYDSGEMLSSLQVAVRALPADIGACLVALADQPWLEPRVMETLLDTYAAGPAGIVAPAYGGKRGHPVLIDRRHWPALLALPPGGAPRDLLSRQPDDTVLVPLDTDSILRDMDTWDAYQQALLMDA